MCYYFANFQTYTVQVCEILFNFLSSFIIIVHIFIQILEALIYRCKPETKFYLDPVINYLTVQIKRNEFVFFYSSFNYEFSFNLRLKCCKISFIIIIIYFIVNFYKKILMKLLHHNKNRCQKFLVRYQMVNISFGMFPAS